MGVPYTPIDVLNWKCWVALMLFNIMTGIYSTYSVHKNGPELQVGSTVPIYVDLQGHYIAQTVNQQTAKLYLFFLFDTLWTFFCSAVPIFFFRQYMLSMRYSGVALTATVLCTGVSIALMWGIFGVYSGIVDKIGVAFLVFFVMTAFFMLYLSVGMRQHCTKMQQAKPVIGFVLVFVILTIGTITRATEVIDANAAVPRWIVPSLVFLGVGTTVYAGIFAYSIWKEEKAPFRMSSIVWILCTIIIQSVFRMVLGGHVAD